MDIYSYLNDLAVNSIHPQKLLLPQGELGGALSKILGS